MPLVNQIITSLIQKNVCTYLLLIWHSHNDLPWCIRSNFGNELPDLSSHLAQCDTDLPRMRQGMVGAQVRVRHERARHCLPEAMVLLEVRLLLMPKAGDDFRGAAA